MKHSPEINEIAPALVAAQKEFPSINKSKHVSAGARSYKYAPLDEILEAVTPALNSQNIAVIQGHDADYDGLVITTTLLHKSGQWINSSLRMTPKAHDPQSMGSAITYGRRYDLLAILGICPDEDDDAQAAMPQTEPVQQKQYQKPQAVQETNPRDAIIEDIKETMRLLRLSSAQVHQLTQVKPNTPNIEELTTVKHYLEDLYKRVHNGEILSPAELEAIRGAVS